MLGVILHCWQDHPVRLSNPPFWSKFLLKMGLHRAMHIRVSTPTFECITFVYSPWNNYRTLHSYHVSQHDLISSPVRQHPGIQGEKFPTCKTKKKPLTWGSGAAEKTSLSLSLLVFYVTCNVISYMWRHRCAGRLKKKLYLRSGTQRHRHFAGFFNVSVLHRHGTTLFIRWFGYTAPFYI